MMFDTSKLKELAISESGLIFDPSTGTIFTSNPVGLLILGALKDGKEGIDVCNLVVKNYDIDAPTAERDIYDFYGQLHGNGVIKDV